MTTSDVMVFTKSSKRWFDLDAERVPFKPETVERFANDREMHYDKSASPGRGGGWLRMPEGKLTQPGAPLLDWWEIPETDDTYQPEEPKMTARYLIGDVLEVAKTIEPGSVDLIVSSPPFLAVRSYLPADHPDKAKEGGQQTTPGGYIDWLIDVVEAVGPCLAPHGSLVFELGDTYAGSGGAGGDYQLDGWRAGQPGFKGSMKTERQHKVDGWGPFRDEFGKTQPGGNGWPRAKSKSLIPELFRLALTYGLNPLTGRTTGRWILRNVITWCRPNPTPGALGDKVRPATSDIACFTRSGKRWFDLDAERTTPIVQMPPSVPNGPKAAARAETGIDGRGRLENRTMSAGAPLLDWWELPPEQPTEPPKYPSKYGRADDSRKSLGSGSEFSERGNAPPLDFWVLPPGGYSGAHYAVWPPELVRRLINLMCPMRVCVTCGEPSRRIVNVEYESDGDPMRQNAEQKAAGRALGVPIDLMREQNPQGMSLGRATKRVDTLGWSDCGHDPDNWRDGMVLDPFCGSGTTLAVASGMGRESIGIDLDERNLDLARERVGLFLEVAE